MLLRVHPSHQGYWVFHKNLIDESHEALLEKRPEDRVWRIISPEEDKESSYPSHRLRRHDFFKVARVRYKVRECESSFYREENDQNQFAQDQFRMLYQSQKETTLKAELLNSFLEEDISPGAHMHRANTADIQSNVLSN